MRPETRLGKRVVRRTKRFRTAIWRGESIFYVSTDADAAVLIFFFGGGVITGVGINAVVRLHNDKALPFIIRLIRARRHVHRLAGTPQPAALARQRRRQARGVEAVRRCLALVHDSVVAHVREHRALRERERVDSVRLPELQRAEHQEKVQHVRLLHLEVLGVVQVLDQQRPDLRVAFLEEEGEAVLCDCCLGALASAAVSLFFLGSVGTVRGGGGGHTAAPSASRYTAAQ